MFFRHKFSPGISLSEYNKTCMPPKNISFEIRTYSFDSLSQNMFSGEFEGGKTQEFCIFIF